MLKYLIILLFLIGIPCFAATNSIPVSPLNNTNTENVINAQATNGLLTATSWIVIPYMSYDISQKKYGYGGVILHEVSKNLWAGLRYEDLDSSQSSAAVQAQLQISGTLWGITYTPFIETSVGIGSSYLDGNAGPGILVTFWDYQWDKSNGQYKYGILFGAAGDYEHYVNGPISGNKIDGGLVLSLSF